MEGDQGSSSFPIGSSAPERGLSYVPKCYAVQSPDRPSTSPETANVPVIDLGRLRQGTPSHKRIEVIKEIGDACRQMGFFQVVNHGICQSTLDGAISAASDFFKYGTSLKDGDDKVQFWRIFLKHYANPLSKWIHLWPTSPPHFRENMGSYCTEVMKLAGLLMGAITESLGLGPTYLSNKMEEGTQVIALNCYPPCPNPEIALGLPPHSDYSCLTIMLQSFPGLEIVAGSEDGKWRLVPRLHGALQVHVGDHIEVLSNGLYKSVIHRARLNSERTRISIASLHSLGMDEKMATAEELVDDEHPKGYKESSFRDFLDFLSKNDIAEGKTFINTLKIQK
ncbi:hypothetical protein K2173_027623 [Erythroxylum novogranatense]|uniref:Fe2OG dioxygenase domain-containing protein n=1 Tax=Erythroxylum novogranatense TaxID=1862640 RepID=A0AAV8TZM1_9ROSI|nr:hypothetical protein K2173_027623 [Erythroxylum novogranatense]